MTIAEIKKYMKERKITQMELSDMSGIPLQTIRKIFCGVTGNPRVDTMKAIERALNIPENFSTTITETLTPDEYDLLTAYKALSKEQKALLVQLAEQMVALQK